MRNRFLPRIVSLFCLLWAASVLPALAQADSRPTLTVYTYDIFAKEVLTPDLRQQFEAQCQCRLNVVGLSDAGDIMTRLQLEGRHTSADVVLGIDNNLRAKARRSGLFAPLPSDVDKRLGTPTLPIKWQDATFMPVDWSWFTFVYDSQKVPNPPASLDELVKSNLRVVLEDPRTSTPGLGMLLWMKSVFKDQAAERWQQLARHTVTVSRSWSIAYGLFLRGEADAVLSYSTSPAYHIEKEGEHRYKAMNLSEGLYMQVELAGKLAGSPHQPQADQFLTFISQPAFQQRLLVTNWMYPAWHGREIPLPAGYAGSPVPAHTFMMDDATLDAHRADWVHEWQTAVSHARR